LGRVRIPLPNPPFLSSSEGERETEEVSPTLEYKKRPNTRPPVSSSKTKRIEIWCSAIVVVSFFCRSLRLSPVRLDKRFTGQQKKRKEKALKD
jgi:hypothetical protein